jgi:hypothetical protein
MVPPADMIIRADFTDSPDGQSQQGIFSEPWAAPPNAAIWGSHRPPERETNQEE